MGRLIGQIIGRLVGRIVVAFIFGWLLSVCLSLAQRLLRWLELDGDVSKWPWQWVLPRLALLAGIVGLLVAGLFLLVRLLTGGIG